MSHITHLDFFLIKQPVANEMHLSVNEYNPCVSADFDLHWLNHQCFLVVWRQKLNKQIWHKKKILKIFEGVENVHGMALITRKRWEDVTDAVSMVV